MIANGKLADYFAKLQELEEIWETELEAESAIADELEALKARVAAEADA